jgi:hypothetical protein
MTGGRFERAARFASANTHSEYENNYLGVQI